MRRYTHYLALSRNSQQQAELIEVESTITQYYERKTMENEDLSARLRDLSEYNNKAHQCFTYLHAQYQSFTAHLEHYDELKEQNRKIDQMIAESAEYIKCSNGDALNKFIMDEYDKMCSSINELSSTSAECTKAAKYSIKDS